MKAIPKLTPFPNETRLLTVGREALVEADSQLSSGDGERLYIAISRNGFLADYPTETQLGQVSWYNAEKFSRRFRVRASRKIVKLNAKKRA